MIRNVVPTGAAESWNETLEQYLDNKPQADPDTSQIDEVDGSSANTEVFWSLAQLNARAHPNVLAVQKLLMSQCWHGRRNPADPTGDRISPRHPVTCADKVHTVGGKAEAPSPNKDSHKSNRAAPHAYTRAVGSSEISAYKATWDGWWEKHDPWDSAERLETIAQQDDEEGHIFRMFEGMLPLSTSQDADSSSALSICPLPPELVTAYRLLRPFFTPKRSPLPSPGPNATEDFLLPSNWSLVDASRRPLAVAEQRREVLSATTHPHLRLEKTLIPLCVSPGDYVVWHPDVLYSLPARGTHNGAPSKTSTTTTLVRLPACPLTRDNAFFLARQRRAFILGLPGPALAAVPARSDTHSSVPPGESSHMGRPGTQDIYDMGGEDALRAMGLLAWEERVGEEEGCLVEMANRILFPDRVPMRRGFQYTK